MIQPLETREQSHIGVNRKKNRLIFLYFVITVFNYYFCNYCFFNYLCSIRKSALYSPLKIKWNLNFYVHCEHVQKCWGNFYI